MITGGRSRSVVASGGGGGSSALRIEVLSLSAVSSALGSTVLQGTGTPEHIPFDTVDTAGDDVSLDGSGYQTWAAGRWLLIAWIQADFVNQANGFYDFCVDPSGTPATFTGDLSRSGAASPFGSQASNVSGGTPAVAIWDSNGTDKIDLRLSYIQSSTLTVGTRSSLIGIRLGDVPA